MGVAMIKTNFLVRFTECDPYGIASHPNYFNWLMECRIDYFRKCGLTVDDFNNSNILLVIVRINMICKDACTFGDQIEIETILQKINKKSIAFKYIAKNINTNRVVFEAETVNFVINKEGTLCSFPDYIYEKIINYNNTEGGG
ncbi:MAG TPA: acyl-CoA thioesterase [Nitrospirae bacterium]|nr:acyl-CoA thioesterase [Nitrospirota bacterium]